MSALEAGTRVRVTPDGCETKTGKIVDVHRFGSGEVAWYGVREEDGIVYDVLPRIIEPIDE